MIFGAIAIGQMKTRIKKQIAELPDIVSQDEAYQNAMRYSDAQNARDESDRAAFEGHTKNHVERYGIIHRFSERPEKQ